MPSQQVLDAARRWRDHDPDPTTRAELDALIDQRADELSERFSGPLTFGTAGLRGVVGAGESRMNRAVVRRTSFGLASYLLAHVADAKDRGVVVGYDGRRQSDVFARDTAAVLCARGIKVWLADALCPTPVVAYAVNACEAAAGVMVTASHNPPEYNGYKVYAANGAQIIPPADEHIAACIEGAGPADTLELADLDAARASGRLVGFGSDLDARYLEAVAALVVDGGDRSLPIVYTAMHGVGNALLLRAMQQSGFTKVTSVPEQAEPDGAFPTVAFPNPEEPGALDLALALARAQDAALILANDPDADRLAAAVRTAPGQYQQLTGNEVGILLGHALLERSTAGAARLVIASVVSSPSLAAIADAMGARFAYTLTGFKWIANKAMELEPKGAEFLFGYEEALGYSVGTLVRDKDGISAAVVLAALAAELYARGETLLDQLERIARRYGLYTSAQRSLKFPGSEGKQAMSAIMTRLRQAPPTTIGDHDVVAFSDCLTGVRHQGDERGAVDLPTSDVLIFDLAGGHRVIARPSGTEPKMKIYFDVRADLADGENLEVAKSRATDITAALEKDILALAGV